MTTTLDPALRDQITSQITTNELLQKMPEEAQFAARSIALVLPWVSEVRQAGTATAIIDATAEGVKEYLETGVLPEIQRQKARDEQRIQRENRQIKRYKRTQERLRWAGALLLLICVFLGFWVAGQHDSELTAITIIVLGALLGMTWLMVGIGVLP
jgi:hypothetical protein